MNEMKVSNFMMNIPVLMNIPELPEQKLVRWRADPKKIRVTVRRQEVIEGIDIYCVKLFCKTTGRILAAAWDSVPRNAIMRALRFANRNDVSGIDLHMQWAYEHPWKKRNDK